MTMQKTCFGYFIDTGAVSQIDLLPDGMHLFNNGKSEIVKIIEAVVHRCSFK